MTPSPRRSFVRPADVQCVYGRLHLSGEKHELSWTLDRPFRPLDLFLWGQTNETVLHRFVVGADSQFIGSFVVPSLLKEPFDLPAFLAFLEEAPENDRLIGVRLKQPIHRVNDGFIYSTASTGQQMCLELEGPIEHVVVFGVSV